MNIDWNPSERLLAKMKKVQELTEKGKTNVEIAQEIGNDRSYVIALKRKFRILKGKE